MGGLTNAKNDQSLKIFLSKRDSNPGIDESHSPVRCTSSQLSHDLSTTSLELSMQISYCCALYCVVTATRADFVGTTDMLTELRT